jgi:hypothetical protein
MKLPHCTYLDLGKVIFLFFVTVTTVVATPAHSSYRWGSGGSSDGRATETPAVENQVR